MIANGQSVDEIKQQFPGADIVYQNYEQELRLSLKDDQPCGERKTSIDLLMLTDKNVNMLSRYTVYHSSYNELKDLNAYTMVPSGNRYKTEKVTNTKTTGSTDASIFYDDARETSFDFPALTQYAVAHVDYTQFNKDAHLLTGFYIPLIHPVVNASFTVVVPNEISIRYLIKNDSNNLFQFTEQKKKKETIYKWTLKNVRSLDYYSNSPDRRYFEPHIIIHITSFRNKDGDQPFLGSLTDLHKWNYSFIKDLNTSEDPNLKKTVDSLVKDETSEKTKVRKIYQWVQQHIKYVAFEDGLEGFRPRQAGEVNAKRYGDCKDMCSIITQMLRMAGIRAYYTWIGTRDIPYSYTEIPLPLVDNHMISTANIDGNWFFLDGTNPNAKFDMPPAFIQGKQALVCINESEYKILTVPVAEPERSVLIDSTFVSISDDGIKGYETVNYSGYFGQDLYTSLLYKSEKETKEFISRKMSKGSNKYIMGKYSINRINPEESIMNISADFELPGYSKKAGKEYYINLNLVKPLENQVINTEKRKVPIETEFNYSITEYHILKIPEGYSVSYLPKDFTYENSLLKVGISYKVENEKVISCHEIKSKKLMIDTSEFDEWNKPIKAIQPYYKESVVLEKK